MNEKPPETNIEADAPEGGYMRYKELGGTNSESDYLAYLEMAYNTDTISGEQRKQLELLVKPTGIELGDSEDSPDTKTKLYGILRSSPFFVNMSDHLVLAEALRILGDSDNLKKLVEIYPDIVSH